ncbi:MAG TPA: glutaredoxin family protein [Armatimonadota bacterium]|jgi:glutaredoxin-like YruB-family protein
MASEVVVYTQPGCAPCQQVKEYLKQKGVDFTEVNIREDAAAMKKLIEMQVSATPAVVIDGNLVRGFDRKAIDGYLAAAAAA